MKRTSLAVTAAVAAAAPSATIVTAPSFVYNWREQHCPSFAPFDPACYPDVLYRCDPDVVDSPMKGFRNASGVVTMLGPVDLGSRAFIGSNVTTVAHTCPVYAQSTNISTPSYYADREWIHSTWYFPENGSVVALTHMEDHDPVTMGGRMSAVTLYASQDSGRSWLPIAPPPAHVVALAPYQWNASDALFGFRSPSNILAGRGALAGWYYATVTAGWGDDFGLQAQGTCMMRTRDLTDPTAWRAWNGSAFSVSLSDDPYTDPNLDPAQHVCAPFTLATYPSLLWSTFFGRYMLFTTTGGNDGAGWSFALSDDLIQWDDPVVVNTSGLIAPGGNGSVVLLPQSSMPGRFVLRNHSTDGAVFWEDPTGTSKHYVGSCTPCPGYDACATPVRIPDAVFDALTTGAPFSCGRVSNATGYSHFYYPSMLDPASPSANFDDAGQSAALFLVAEACVGATPTPDGHGVQCDSFNADGQLVRDVVRVTVVFDA